MYYYCRTQANILQEEAGNFYYTEMCLGNDMFSTFNITYIYFPKEGLKCAEKQKSSETYLLVLSLNCN